MAAEVESVPEKAADRWGAGLGYPAWAEAALPAVHRGFNTVNRYLGVPALRMGLGAYMSNPLTGYLMVLRTRGRKSGRLREIPLGYTIHGDAVYCLSGFGRQAHWFQNILADPRVEVVLPGRSFSGVAEEVTDEAERMAVLPGLLKSMGGIVVATGIGNPWRDPAERIAAKCEHFPLVRVRSTGIAAGPDDPGGWSWVVPFAATGGFVLWRLLHRRRDPS